MEKTYNKLVGQIAQRTRELANHKMDALRLLYPVTTETPGELRRIAKQECRTRGDLIEAILVEEFSLEYDMEIESC